MDSKTTQSSVLIVDDHIENIDILRSLLREDYKIFASTDGETAIEIANKMKPNIILLDVMMPGLNGYEVCKVLKANLSTSHIPVIFVTAMSDEQDECKGLELGALDYITKPINAQIVKQRVKNHIALADRAIQLESEVAARTLELQKSQLEVVLKLGLAAEYKDNETGMHVKRMSHYTYLIAKSYGLSESHAQMLLSAAPMHDIGKIGIPDHVLQKPGKFEPHEWQLMKTHAQVGADILKSGESKLLKLAEIIAISHHEKWDGTGYPKGLARDEIPLEGRIVAVADVFDALTNSRVYKNAWDVKDAIALIKDERNKHFDAKVVDAFLRVIDEILSVRDKYKEIEVQVTKE